MSCLQQCAGCSTSSSLLGHAFSTQAHDDGHAIYFDTLGGQYVTKWGMPVCTVFAVWPGDVHPASMPGSGITGSSMLAAGIMINGCHTVMCIALKGHPGTHHFGLKAHGSWTCLREVSRTLETKAFCPRISCALPCIPVCLGEHLMRRARRST